MRPHTLTSLEARGMSLGPRRPRANPTDVAAHLARFNNRPLETLALCLIHWHGGIIHCRAAAESSLLLMAHEIIRGQAVRIIEVRLALESESVSGNAKKAEALKRRLQGLKEERWPESRDGKYIHIFRGAFQEFSHPILCVSCEGRGITQAKCNAPVSECGRCCGSGREPKTSNARATMCGVHPQSYNEAWCRPYVWTLGEISAAYRRAVNELEND